MWTVVVALDVLSSAASLAMAGYGLLILMMSQFDPLHTDRVGMTFGLGLVATFLIVPTFCVVTSLRLASRDRRSSILLALVPFVLIALGLLVIHEFPWPAGPAN
jgi:hypothetical protein